MHMYRCAGKSNVYVIFACVSWRDKLLLGAQDSGETTPRAARHRINIPTLKSYRLWSLLSARQSHSSLPVAVVQHFLYFLKYVTTEVLHRWWAQLWLAASHLRASWRRLCLTWWQLLVSSYKSHSSSPSATKTLPGKPKTMIHVIG